ncbi:hypothetical protein BESB_034780 [Besnoitia besnoiti]|uniref:Tetratricopeptide repeat-containing protein n=1 Tax=Besnoitia besnoiti TaxID=94643 RepID=A0A2A9MN15_BESBE|nr:hypothetical protein BESB_034780 [Besnoitia besnoiti]PFH37020.1 hypothetical protein BESB_034780 [Besnoitia besnoiti]
MRLPVSTCIPISPGPTGLPPVWTATHARVPLLAVCSSNSEEVHVISKHGAPIACIQHVEAANEGRASQLGRVSALTWHPRQTAVFVGWASGRVSCWRQEGGSSNPSEGLRGEGRVEAVDIRHKAPISGIAFSTAGRLCVSTDHAGAVVVSSVEAPERSPATFSTDCEYRQQSSVRFVAFRLRGSGSLGTHEKPTFFLTENSTVVYEADHRGLRSRRYTSTEPLVFVDYMAAADSLVIVSAQGCLTQLGLPDDGRPRVLLQSKLDGFSNPGLTPQFAWMDDASFAFITQDPIVRFWSFVTRESHVLSLHAETGDDSLAGDGPSSLAFSKRTNSLFVGTERGHIVRCRGRQAATSSDSAWESCELIHQEKDSCLGMTLFNNDDEILAICGKTAVRVVSWIQPAVAAHAGLLALQTGLTEITLFTESPRGQTYGAKSPPEASKDASSLSLSPPASASVSRPSPLSAKLTTGQPVTALSLNESTLAVVSASQVTVFTICQEQESLVASRLSSFETQGVTAAVTYVAGAATTLFLATPRGVSLTSLEGEERGLLRPRHLSEGSAPVPKLLWLDGHTLGMISEDNAVFVWTLGNGTPTLRSAGTVEAPLAGDKSMSVKSLTGARDGSKLAFILRKSRQIKCESQSRCAAVNGSGDARPLLDAESVRTEHMAPETTEDTLAIYDVASSSLRMYDPETLGSRMLSFLRWDERDSRLLAICVWRLSHASDGAPRLETPVAPTFSGEGGALRPHLLTYFIDKDGDVAQQECIPSFITARRPNSASLSAPRKHGNFWTALGLSDDPGAAPDNQGGALHVQHLLPLSVATPFLSFVYFEPAFGAANLSASLLGHRQSVEGAGTDDLKRDSWTLTRASDAQIRRREPSPSEGGLTGLKVAQRQLAFPVFVRRLMRDFRGLDVDVLPEAAISSIMDFSCHLAFNNTESVTYALNFDMPEGLRMELAKMSIRTRRLGIALKCLGKLKLPKLHAALRKAENEADEVKLALAAIHLGLHEEVEPLYRSCGRLDLLQTWLQANARWEDALLVAEDAGRLHALRTHALHSHYLENAGDWGNALHHLQLACPRPCAPSRGRGGPRASDPCRSRASSLPSDLLAGTASYSPSAGNGKEAAAEEGPCLPRLAADASGGLRPESPRVLRLAGRAGDVGAYLDRQADPHLYRWCGRLTEMQAWVAQDGAGASGAPASLRNPHSWSASLPSLPAAPRSCAGAAASGLQDGASREASLSPQTRRRKALLKQALEWYWRGNLLSHQVRVLCALDQLDAARKICTDSGDKGASLVLAHELERRGHVRDAVRFYTNAGELRKALSLGQYDGLETDLMAAALNAGQDDMVAAAICFYERREYEKAVALFRKAGQLDTALQVCLTANLRESMRLLSEEATPSSDPLVIEACAKVLVEAGMIDRAIELLAKTKRFDAALHLCETRNVALSESLVNALTPSKEEAIYCLPAAVTSAGGSEGTSAEHSAESETDSDHQMITALEARRAVLIRLGELCLKQEMFHLACRSFTAAREKVAAVNCLLKTRDTEKLIYFANTARDPEVYVAAANYLQGLDHFADEALRGHIVSFYQKANAFPKLAAFYINLARREIEQYSAYGRALAALQESRSYLIHCPDAAKKIGLVDARIEIIDRYLDAKELCGEDPEGMIASLLSLLETPGAEKVLKLGDVFADMGRYYASVRDFPAVISVLKEMQQRNIPVLEYMSRDMVRNACAAVRSAVGDEPLSASRGTELGNTEFSSALAEGFKSGQETLPQLVDVKYSFDAPSSKVDSIREIE